MSEPMIISGIRSRPPNAEFLITFVVCVVGALAIAAWTPLREAATTIVFIPLFWASIRLSVRGMTVTVAILIATRIIVEALHAAGGTGAVEPGPVLREALFPIWLYPAIAIAFTLYRRHEQQMTQQIARSEAMATVQNLAGSVAHDFNNVLQVMVGTAQLLEEDPSLPDELREEVRNIVAAGRQASELVQDMRTFAGRGHKVAVHDLSEVMDRQMNLLTRGMPRDIDVKWRRSTEELPVMLDPLQIARVLTNLCANAANAMPEGGRLDVRTAKVSYGGKESAALIVSDSGRGIDPKQLRKIFDPFFSGQASKTGQGLGLAIVRGIVQEHDGKIEVVSHPGRGTTVTAYFPLHAGPAEPAADAA